FHDFFLEIVRAIACNTDGDPGVVRPTGSAPARGLGGLRHPSGSPGRRPPRVARPPDVCPVSTTRRRGASMRIVSALIAALAVGYQDPDTKPWQTVVSQEGKFLVDFPAAPTIESSQTESGPGGRIKVIIVGCETPPVDYIAEKIIVPTAIVRGAEE